MECDADATNMYVCVFGSNGSKTISVSMVYNAIARQVLIKFKSIWLYLSDYCCTLTALQTATVSVDTIEFAEQSEIA